MPWGASFALGLWGRRLFWHNYPNWDHQNACQTRRRSILLSIHELLEVFKPNFFEHGTHQRLCLRVKRSGPPALRFHGHMSGENIFFSFKPTCNPQDQQIGQLRITFGTVQPEGTVWFKPGHGVPGVLLEEIDRVGLKARSVNICGKKELKPGKSIYVQSDLNRSPYGSLCGSILRL